MKEIYDFAIQLAEKAGQNTLKYFEGEYTIEQKDDDSPVTIADKTTEELIRAEIENHFPEDGILGEEFEEKPSRSGLRWVIDPIDGTKTFIHGVPLYGTLIALEQNGESQIGVVRYPPLKFTLSAMKQYGCYCNGQRCHVSKTNKLDNTSFLYTDAADIIHYFGEQALFNLLNQTALQRTWADCYGYYLVAAGKAEVMVDATLKRWDIAPMIPIIEEAGGTLTDIEYQTSNTIANCIATNGLIHQNIIDLIKNGTRGGEE